MSLVIAVVQSAAPRRDTGSMTAAVNLVRQVGATVATAIIGGVVGVGVAALLPSSLDPAALTPQLVHAASTAVQSEVAAIYRDVFAPVFAALGVAYTVGLIAAILLPPGRLSDESEQTPAPSAEPLTA